VLLGESKAVAQLPLDMDTLTSSASCYQTPSDE